MLADGGSIVKSIIRDQGKAPCLILYSEKQLEDLRSMCCTGQSILGIDKTFNLCDMHVMASCYKQTSVKMETTGEPPIFFLTSCFGLMTDSAVVDAALRKSGLISN